MVCNVIDTRDRNPCYAITVEWGPNTVRYLTDLLYGVSVWANRWGLCTVQSPMRTWGGGMSTRCTTGLRLCLVLACSVHGLYNALWHHLISVQSLGRARSSSVVTLARPSVSSSLQITNRSFRYASPYLWNKLPSSFRQPHSVHSAFESTLNSLSYRIVSYCRPHAWHSLKFPTQREPSSPA